MQKVIDNSRVPFPGYHKYVHVEDSHAQTHPYFNVLKNEVKKYRQINQYPIGSNFDEEFEDNLCSHAAPGVCFDFIPPSLADKANTLRQALVRHAKNGFKVVSEEEHAYRLSICQSCNFFGGMKGLLKIACKRCGCGGLKLSWKSEKCPIDKWNRL